MTVRIYQNTDVGAPVLSNTANSLNAVLEACLVNGYGTQTAAGWTKAFTSGNTSVFRNSTTALGSSGCYVQVNDSNTSYALARAYKTMTAVNTGTDVTPNSGQMSQSDVFWFKYSYGTGTPKRWVIIADERTFYMNIFIAGAYPTDQADYCALFGAGDFDSFVPGNNWNYMVFGSGSNSYTTSNKFPATGSAGQYTIAIGRPPNLALDTSSAGWCECLRSTPGETGNHLVFSTDTALRFFQRPYLGSLSGGSVIIGEFRGCMYHVGRGVTTWMENFGKLPSDPTGPDLIQLVSVASVPSMVGSLLVKNSDW